MDRLQTVSRIMTRDVESVQIDQKLSEVRRMLAARPFHHVPVCRGEHLVGLISMADIAPLTLGAYVDDPATVDAHLDQRHDLIEVMTPEPVSVDAGASVREAAELLAEGQFHALPVVDGAGRLQGIVTSTDLIRWFLTL
ncbi:MAG: CBS domain-containing protein [Alphaproteobacteria bacterium]|nr:CBS domain-containing protein [Alphaproteobacteria bacterium]